MIAVDARQSGRVAGIDIGGTKIATLVVDGDGTVRGRASRPFTSTDQPGAIEAIVAGLDAALAMAGLDRTELDALGIGVPGRVEPGSGRVTLAVNLGWTDVALRDELERATGRPTVIENDARAAAVGLHQRGLSGPTGDLAYLAVGTGIAAGVVLDGRLRRGARGLAGEIGHAIVDPSGPRCGCGQDGCLEALASGPAIARLAIEAGADRATTSVEVYRAAADGDPTSLRLVEAVGRRLAWAVHTLVMAYDVDRVVIGGGVSHAGRMFEAPLQRELDRLRVASALASALLSTDLVTVLPPEADPGAWGAVAIARAAVEGSEVVGHV
jgi:glucokinase